MIVDLHTHTREHSECSQQTAGQLIQRAREIGLDGVVITDHDFLWNVGDLAEVMKQASESGLTVLRGQEVSCPDGHLLVYGIEQTLIGGRSRRDLAERVRQTGGATILPHPLRWGGFKDQGPEEVAEYFRHFDAVEVWSINHSEQERERAAILSLRAGVRLVAASDAHSVEQVGSYALRFSDSLASEQDLVQALRTDQFAPVRRLPSGDFVPVRREAGLSL